MLSSPAWCCCSGTNQCTSSCSLRYVERQLRNAQQFVYPQIVRRRKTCQTLSRIYVCIMWIYQKICTISDEVQRNSIGGSFMLVYLCLGLLTLRTADKMNPGRNIKIFTVTIPLMRCLWRILVGVLLLNGCKHLRDLLCKLPFVRWKPTAKYSKILNKRLNCCLAAFWLPPAQPFARVWDGGGSPAGVPAGVYRGLSGVQPQPASRCRIHQSQLKHILVYPVWLG